MFSRWSAWRGFQMGLGRQAEKCMVMLSSKMVLWGAKLTFAEVYFKNKSHLGNTSCLGINIFSWKWDLKKNRLCVTAYCTYSSFSLQKRDTKTRILVLKFSLTLLELSMGSAASKHHSRERFIKMLFLMGNPTPHFNRLQKAFLYHFVLKFYCTTRVYPELSFSHFSANT